MSSSEIPARAEAPARIARPPRVWKFWGTCLWGALIFAAMFAGQFALVASRDRTVRLTRSLGRILRYFIAKRAADAWHPRYRRRVRVGGADVL